MSQGKLSYRSKPWHSRKQNHYAKTKAFSFLNKHPKKTFTQPKTISSPYSTLSARPPPFPHWKANLKLILNKSSNLHPGKCKIHNQNPVSIPYFLQKIILYQHQNPTFDLYKPTNSNQPMRMNTTSLLITDLCILVFDITNMVWLTFSHQNKTQSWTIICSPYNGKI